MFLLAAENLGWGVSQPPAGLRCLQVTPGTAYPGPCPGNPLPSLPTLFRRYPSGGSGGGAPWLIAVLAFRCSGVGGGAGDLGRPPSPQPRPPARGRSSRAVPAPPPRGARRAGCGAHSGDQSGSGAGSRAQPRSADAAAPEHTESAWGARGAHAAPSARGAGPRSRVQECARATAWSRPGSPPRAPARRPPPPAPRPLLHPGRARQPRPRPVAQRGCCGDRGQAMRAAPAGRRPWRVSSQPSIPWPPDSTRDPGSGQSP